MFSAATTYALDAMAGCDCTNNFYYRGKSTVFEIVCDDLDVIDLLSLNRSDFDETYKAVKKIIIEIYNKTGSSTCSR